MAIVDRIFNVGTRPSCDGAGAQGRAQTMLYEDFIYFMLSEEDKGNKASLQYWFTCVDFDGDGVITPADMRVFYDVQVRLRLAVAVDGCEHSPLC
jgi:serine/threonine-protein phosphatase 2A regulatory subunit B''